MRWLEKTAIILAAVAVITLFLATAGYAQAVPRGATNVSVIGSTFYNVSAGGLPSVQAQAGNVTELLLNATTLTTSWAGFYGNVTGKMLLADSTGNNLYDWNMTSPSGEVFASRSNSVAWASINCSNVTTINSEQSYLGQGVNDPDSVNNTFRSTGHPTFLVGSRNMTTCPSTKAYDSTQSQGTSFWQVLLNDNTNTVYTTILDTTGSVGFNNRPWQFQLLVGENGKTTNATVLTPYYFYVELQ